MGYAEDIQADLQGSGMRTIQEPQMVRGQQNASFMMNLGRFAMFSGLGMMQGIGAGLAATDLRNPFKGPGAALQGGSGIGAVAAGNQLSAESNYVMREEKDAYEKSKKALEEEERKQMDKTYKPAKIFKRPDEVAPRPTEEQQDPGFYEKPDDVESKYDFRLGLKSPSLALFGAQQAMAQVKEADAMSKARAIMLGMRGNR